MAVKSSPAVAVPPTIDQLRLDTSGASAGVRVSGNRSTAPSALPSTTDAPAIESTGGAGRPSSSVIERRRLGLGEHRAVGRGDRRPNVSGASGVVSWVIGTVTVAVVCPCAMVAVPALAA